MTQAELAQRFGVRQQTLGAWERGERPKAQFLRALATYVGLPGAEELTVLLDQEGRGGASHQRPAVSDDNVDESMYDILARSFAARARRGPLEEGEIALFRELLQRYDDSQRES